MQTFDQALFDLYSEGAIKYEEALRNADSMNELRLQIKLHSPQSDQPATTPSSLSMLEDSKANEDETKPQPEAS